MKYLKLSTLFLLISFLSSCKDEYEPEKNKTLAMAGEWWYEIYDETGELVYGYADIAHALTTTNTAADSDNEMWFDDAEAGFVIKSRVPVDLNSLSFLPSGNLENLYDESVSIKIAEGKVLKNAATAPSGHKSDSLYIKFSIISNNPDDPFEETYIFTGYKSTGWPEDRWDL